MGRLVPFRPRGVEASGFRPASILDVMEVRRDLRKFITETFVAESRGVLSSGREARGDISWGRKMVQLAAVAGTGRGPLADGTD
jgi:hypothetical protein